MPPLFLQTIEQTSLSTWLRDSTSLFGFWFVLTFHAIGMALLVGASGAMALRVLGVARDLPLALLNQLSPVVWAGFWIQVVSGVLLLLAYPTKSLTNLNFYVKLGLIALGMLVTLRLKREVLVDSTSGDTALLLKGKPFAIWSLVLWLGAITTGRFLAYSATYLTYPLD